MPFRWLCCNGYILNFMKFKKTLLLGYALLAASFLQATPSVFWISSPVRSNETVYLQGDGLTEGVGVEYARMPDAEPGDVAESGSLKGLVWKRVKPLKATGGSLFFVLPADETSGAFQVRLKDAGEAVVRDLNLPEVWWTQGEGGKATAYPGGWLRVFGRSLEWAGKQPRFALRSNGKTVLSGTLTALGDGYSLSIALPNDLALGNYTLWIHNGSGGTSAWRSAGELTVQEAPVWPGQVFNVTQYGAVANDGSDALKGIQAALDAAGKAGGGVVMIPAGRYRLSGGLVVPQHVTLRGESEALTALQWDDYGVGTPKAGLPDSVKQGEPPIALIHGEGSFKVEDLSLYAWSHYHGIWAQHWKGLGNVHLKNVRMRLDERLVNLGRFLAAKEGWYSSDCKEKADRLARRQGFWVAGFFGGGPNLSVENCDFENNGHGIMIDNGHGVVIRNNRANTVFLKGTDSLILEENKVHSFWPGTHDSSQDPLRRWKMAERRPNASTQYLYMARNHASTPECDREATSIDSHAPFGVYLGAVVKVEGRVLTLTPKSASDQVPPAVAPVGYGVYILDGKGAGQFRRVTGGGGIQVEMDRPFEVQPDASSVISIAKYHGELLYVDNDFTDTGDIQIWGGAVNTVFKGTTLTRTGGFNQAGGFIFGGVIPIWNLEQLDTHVLEGNSPGGPPVFQLRPTDLSMNTYRHPDFYQGPCVMGAILRRAVAENFTRISITGGVRGALVEHCTLKKNDTGIALESRASFYKDPTIQKERRSPDTLLLRGNRFEEVQNPVVGDAQSAALVVP